MIPKIYDDLINIHKDKKKFTVKDAISDLPPLKPGEGVEKIRVLKKNKNDYLKKITNSKFIYNHVARNHNEKTDKGINIWVKIIGHLEI